MTKVSEKAANLLLTPWGVLDMLNAAKLAKKEVYTKDINPIHSHADTWAAFEANMIALEKNGLIVYQAKYPKGMVVRITEKVMKRSGFSVKTFANTEEMREMIGEAQQVLHQAFSEGHRYVPATDDEFNYAAEDLIAIADPRLIKVIMKNDKIAGFLFAYHDISAGLQRANGRLLPFGWLHILLDKRRTKWVNINGLGILPEYQGRGGNAVLYYEIAKTFQAFDFEDCETVWIGQENSRSLSDNTTLGVTWYKRHRNYIKKL